MKKQRKKGSPAPRPQGWITSDADEIERRRERGAAESFHIVATTPGDDFYGLYQVSSVDGGRSYRVEIRSLTELINSCSCPDHRVNGLGTCKHVEATLLKLQHRRKRAFRAAAATGSPFVEIFLDRQEGKVRIRWPERSRQRSRTRDLLSPWFDEENLLAGEPLDVLPAVRRAIDALPAAARRKIRFSPELGAWLETLDRRSQLVRSRQHFETEVAAGRASLDLVRHPLYPYQQEGMLHLAFTGRALLADEMGLGKTVQAIAACELLRRTQGIHRVLVISPASLKGEWEEQIGKFTDLPSRIIQGPRAHRLRQYGDAPFFSLANYEQIRPDAGEINAVLRPDVIILDEAQRIKNWRTKTADAVKRLESPYAFVLTGTPIENRIDEIYSIAQFLDPAIFGPLFRFNREFYHLDEKGRAVGYRNLDRLHQRLRPVMLRRRKEEVEGQLPGRTVNTYFVPMHKEQVLRYEEYESGMARLAAMARRRPLKKEEMERLQRYLACMRMICDTPFILDQECRVSPKLKELQAILDEILAEGEHKIIVFSEWQRMLELVREQAEKMGLGYAWHTGTVPQRKRREEIRRFKGDPECRLFLSTDSGATGLNLQAADVVINLDMPWNPARLEQRIARAWRKHQKRPVQVINLVSEHTIEHRMLALLEQKRALAVGVLDGTGEREMALPSGRAAFLDRLDALMGAGTAERGEPPADPADRLRKVVLDRWQDDFELVELHGEHEDGVLLVVADRTGDALRKRLERRLKEEFPGRTPRLQLLDRSSWAAIQRLVEAGVLGIGEGPARTLYRRAENGRRDEERSKRLAEARRLLTESEHKRRMAKVLSAGGFPVEAVAPMREAMEKTLEALLRWRRDEAENPVSLESIDSVLVQTGLLAPDSLPLVSRLREDRSAMEKAEATRLIEECDALLSSGRRALEAE